jgi:hypothetical protein
MGETADSQLLQYLLNLNPDEVIIPIKVKREEVGKIKAIKLSDQEAVKVQHLQDYLFDRGYIEDNTFASLFQYLFNLAFTLHKYTANEEAKREA